MKTIASNAGVEGAVIIGKVEEQADPSTGYDAATGERGGGGGGGGAQWVPAPHCPVLRHQQVFVLVPGLHVGRRHIGTTACMMFRTPSQGLHATHPALGFYCGSKWRRSVSCLCQCCCALRAC